MENCLETKLKSAVQNDNLDTLYSFNINVDRTALNGNYLKLRINGTSITVRAKGNGHIATSIEGLTLDPQTSLEINSLTDIFISNDTDFKVNIDKKNTLIELEIRVVKSDGSDVSARTPVVNAFDFTQVKTFAACNKVELFKTAYGNLLSIKDNTNLTYVYVAYTNVTGSILNIPTSVDAIYVHNTGVSGSLEDFVSARVSAGQTSKNIICNISNSEVTFGGQNYSILRVAWDDNGNKIVGYNNRNPASATTVYCKGYSTQSEAEAAFPGKTVIRVDA